MASCVAAPLVGLPVLAAAVYRRFVPLPDAQDGFRSLKRKWNFLFEHEKGWPDDDDDDDEKKKKKEEAERYVRDGSTADELYRPLEPRQIRLLRVTCVAAADPVKQFRAELVPLALDQAKLPYLAISYARGDAADPVISLPCGDGALPITPAVQQVLHTLLDEGEVMQLWIDALCVNLDDCEEKSRQVRLMREIYQRACQVVICLGEPSPESDAAMDLLHPLDDAIAWLTRWKQPVTAASVRQTGGSRCSAANYAALGTLVQRPWFSRVWAVQEMAVGSNPVLVCGDRAVEWSVLAHVFRRLRPSLEPLIFRDAPPPGILFRRPAALARIAAMDETRAAVQSRERQSLQDFLVRLHRFEAADPRDKVYGLLGLPPVPDAHLDPALAPAYAESVTPEQVYQFTARHLLLRDGRCTILSRAGIGQPGANEELPSWVPDWRLRGAIPLIGANYKAGGDGQSTSIRAGSDPDQLIIEGVRIDSIAHVSRIHTPPPSSSSSPTTTLLNHHHHAATLAFLTEADTLIRAALTFHNSPYTTYRRLDQLLWRTLLANTSPYPEPRTDLAVYDGYFKAWRRALEEFVATSSEPPPHPGTSTSTANANPTAISRYARAFDAATAHRRLLVTTGGFVGLAPAGARVGDVVMVPFGASTPLLVREVGVGDGTGMGDGNGERQQQRMWRLVGEAFVMGLMEGECMGWPGGMARFRRFVVV